jgi:hypothetical protein
LYLAEPEANTPELRDALWEGRPGIFYEDIQHCIDVYNRVSALLFEQEKLFSERCRVARFRLYIQLGRSSYTKDEGQSAEIVQRYPFIGWSWAQRKSVPLYTFGWPEYCYGHFGLWWYHSPYFFKVPHDLYTDDHFLFTLDGC